jgi:aspartyl-tRNA(Asn)/glutamyl-tRNA(Gln) amidotransferase subunit C
VEVTEDDVRHVASLARIAVDDTDIARLTADLSSILQYVSRISSAEGGAAVGPDQPMRLRPDIAMATDPAPLLEAAPALEEGLFAFPKVLG